MSSTLGELADERRAVSRAIEALRLTPVMFELGARPYPPREVYQQYLAQSDVFIGLYWQRYGQPARGMQVSGLEEEFDLSGALPRLLYVKAPAADRDPRLGDLLARIEDDASSSYRHFRTPTELGRLVRDDLAVLLSERFVAAAGQAAAAAPSPARARGPGPLPALTEGNAAAVAEICRRLEGVPLAIELAAARTRLLDPPALLDRLAASLDTLGTGAVDLPERQRTLRATVEWSVGLLEDNERSLLEVAAVFIDGWTIQAVAQVAGLDEDPALELCEALARHSLVAIDSTRLGPRSRMLETVREFVAERLAARPDAAEIGRRHAGYYRALAEQADRPLRSSESEGLERLQAEAGNLAAGVRWHLAHDIGPLPHLLRVLWLFWTQEDLEREAWSWAEQLLPAAGTLDPQARAELAWVAAVLAVDVGDDAAALAARQRLAPLLAGISDPFLRVVALLAMAWTLPVAGDFDGSLREAAVSLQELRDQDEPVFMGMALFTVGSVDMALGRYDDAMRHLCEARDLAERIGGDWLAAGPRVQLGILAVLRGRLDEARPLLNEALDLSMAARSTPFMTQCLAGYAQLAFADSDPDRAARLEGAAEGLRRRVGLPAWPHLRRVEAELVAQVRHTLGAARFDQAFSAGSALTQREAVAIIRDQRGTGPQTT